MDSHAHNINKTEKGTLKEQNNVLTSLPIKFKQIGSPAYSS